MWLFEYNKTSEQVSDEFAAEVIDQIQSKSKSEFLIIDNEILIPISAIKLLKKLDEGMPPMMRGKTPKHAHRCQPSEQDGKSTHNGVEIPDDLKRPKVPKA